MSWVETLQEQLDQRDQRESKYDSFIDAFQEAARRAATGSSHKVHDEDYDEITKLYSELSIKEDKLKKVTAELKSLDKKYKLLVNASQGTKAEHEENKTQLAQLKRSEQNLQDEILALQIQLNVSEDKNKELQKENAELVKRWMERVAGEADQLNEANAFIESMNKMKSQGSRSRPTGHDVNFQSDSD